MTIETRADPDAAKDAAAIKALRGVVTAVESGVPRYRQAVADKLLDLYNDSWRNEDEPRLTRAQVASRLTLESINVLPDGEIEVFFADGDLFGHVIHLRLDTPGAYAVSASRADAYSLRLFREHVLDCTAFRA